MSYSIGSANSTDFPDRDSDSAESKASENKNPEELSLPGKIGATLFIFLFFGVGLITLLDWPDNPRPDPTITALHRAVRPVELALGLDQNWKLFSPELRGMNFHSQAIITFMDGTMKFYEFPRVERMEFFKKIRREKISKFLNDCFPWPNNDAFLPDTARFIARGNWDPENPPATITFAYNWVDSPKFSQFIKQDELPQQTNRYTFFSYRVQPEDLVKQMPEPDFKVRKLPIEEIDPQWFKNIKPGDLK